MIPRLPISTLFPYTTLFRSIYFPEKKYRFYRVGFPMNFSSHMTPPGCSSMYIEIAHPPEQPLKDEEALRDSLKGLYESGILRSEEHTSELQSRQYLVCRLLL